MQLLLILLQVRSQLVRRRLTHAAGPGDLNVNTWTNTNYSLHCTGCNAKSRIALVRHCAQEHRVSEEGDTDEMREPFITRMLWVGPLAAET